MATDWDIHQEREYAKLDRRRARTRNRLWQMASYAAEHDARWQQYTADQEYQRKLHFESVRQRLSQAGALEQIEARGEQTRETQTDKFRVGQERAQALATQLGLDPEGPYGDTADVRLAWTVKQAQDKAAAGGLTREQQLEIAKAITPHLPDELLALGGTMLQLSAQGDTEGFVKQIDNIRALLVDVLEERRDAAVSAGLAKQLPEEAKRAGWGPVVAGMAPTLAARTTMSREDQVLDILKARAKMKDPDAIAELRRRAGLGGAEE